MARAVAFYESLGFVRKFGGPDARFTSFTHQSVIKTTFLLYVRSSGAISAG
jgi:hypothetical protein